jgi:hypothetical protein
VNRVLACDPASITPTLIAVATRCVAGPSRRMAAFTRTLAMPCGEFRVQLIAVCFSVAWRFSEAFFSANRSPTTMLRTVVRPGTAYRAVRQARTQLQVLKTSFLADALFQDWPEHPEQDRAKKGRGRNR